MFEGVRPYIGRDALNLNEERMYWIKRKIRQIRKVIKYVPFIWKSFDFDYRYATDLFRMQLIDIADFMESDAACTLTAEERSSKIRTAIKLLKKVYDEDYACEYLERVEAKYGKQEMVFDAEEKEWYTLEWTYGGKPETEEIKAFVHKEMEISNAKQEKAHRILWEFISHNIRSWWD
jgi:hypothetical protein